MSDNQQGAQRANQTTAPATGAPAATATRDELFDALFDAGTGEAAARDANPEKVGVTVDVTSADKAAFSGGHGKPSTAAPLAPQKSTAVPARAAAAPVRAPRPAYVLQGQIVTLWSTSGGLRADVKNPTSERIVRGVHPHGVKLHTGPDGHLSPWSANDPRPALVVAAERVREWQPDIEIHVGVGIDSIARAVTDHRMLPDAATEKLVEVARVAHQIGAVSIEWDAEAAWKHREGSPRARYLKLATGFIAQVRELFPDLLQGLTTYDHVLYHPEDKNPNKPDDDNVFPWSSFCDEAGVDYVTYQVYAGDGDDDAKTFTSTAGAKARMARHESQVTKAVERGWIRPDLAPGGKGCLTYVQSHSVATPGSVYLALCRGFASWWATPARLDARGVMALQMATALQRYAEQKGIDPADAVEHWQVENDARYDGAIDGLAGAKMFAAMGLTPIAI